MLAAASSAAVNGTRGGNSGCVGGGGGAGFRPTLPEADGLTGVCATHCG